MLADNTRYLIEHARHRRAPEPHPGLAVKPVKVPIRLKRTKGERMHAHTPGYRGASFDGARLIESHHDGSFRG